MKLQTLELHNFKKHEHLHISFADSLTVIRGPNWAGKSSVLHGLLFVLFGVSAIPGKKEDMVTWGANPKDLKVTLETDKGIISRSFANASVEVNDNVVATGHSSVDLWVQKTFGWDKKTILELLYSPQSETSAILTLGVPALNRLVERLSGADVAERAIKAVSARLSALPTPGEEPEVMDKPEPVEPVAGQLDMATEELASIERRLEEARRTERAAIAAQARADHRAKVQADLGSLVPVDAPEPGLGADLKDRISSAETARRVEARRAELTQWFNTIGVRWEAQEGNIEKAAQVAREVAALNEQRTTIRSELKAAKQSVATLKKAQDSGICHACDRPLDGHDPAKLDSQISSAKQQVSRLTEDDESFTQRIEVLQATELPVPPSDYQERYNEKVEELESLPDPVEIEDTADLQKQLRGWEEYQQKYNQYQARHEALMAALEEAALPDIEFDLSEAERSRASLEQQFSEESARCRTLQVTHVRLTAEHASYQRQLAAHQRWAQTKLGVEKKGNQYREFVKWLKGFKQDALTGAWATICAQAGRVLAEASGGAATALSRAEDGTFTILEQDREVPVSVVSGGMRAIAGTALKLALSRFEFLVLDEASSELNDTNAAGLASALMSSGKQVVMVTHREGEEYLAGQTLELAQK